jgi:exodeoxyribonuclease V gamma subunit
MSTLSAHVGGRAGDDILRARRFGTARHLADLFDRYGVHRPAMVTRWANGDDVDGQGRPLAPDMVWQAALWRLLRTSIGIPSPAERLEPALERLRAAPHLVDLPPRISLFGLTRLAPSVLRALDAISQTRDVHLMLLHPSPVLWSQVDSGQGTATNARNPLLTTWGKDARELQLAIGASVASYDSIHHAGSSSADTLLRKLQDDVKEDVRPPGPPFAGAADARLVISPRDRSVQLHACHGRARQVEVLRDAILHLFADDPTLEPRDVIVMCPDIETFAPLIQATFGAGDDLVEDESDVGGVPSMRVRLADRAVRQTNPVLAALADLLELASARVTASQLVDFISLEPVRRRFRLNDDELTRVEEWVGSTGIRWGLDAAHRAPFKLDGFDANTWRAGIDRVVLGVTMTEDEQPIVGGVLPLDDVDSGDIALAGRLAEMVERVRSTISALTGPQPVTSWTSALADAADMLLAGAPREAWQRAELDRLLQDIHAESGEAASTVLSLPELRVLLADRLRGRPGRVNFRTGHLTVCTLVPMRSVPHRVICLLGLDDGSFPRHGAPDSDDIMAHAPAVGDHDVRSEDRQLLLDALLAAADHLLIMYSGRDERTNARLPPSVPIGELLDVIDATARTSTGRARAHVFVEHPLQAFDTRNFEPGRIVASVPWSFDATARDGALALAGQRAVRPSFAGTQLPSVDEPLVELDDLVRFVQHPTKTFLRQRLGITVGDVDDEPEDAMPIELDGLGKWAVGDRLLAARLAGVAWPAAVAAEQARGLLPPGVLGQRVLDEVRPTVEAIHRAVLAEIGLGVEARTIDVNVDLGAAGVVAGTVIDVHGASLVTATYSRLAAKHRIAAWVRLLAVSATGSERDPRAVSVGKGRGGAGVARIAPMPPALAATHLATILDLYRRGMREPLPIYCNTSEALARKRNARAEWVTDGGFDREDRDPANVFVLGDRAPFAQLCIDEPRPDEAGPGWAADEPTRLGRYARRLWDGLLGVEDREGL